MKIKFHKYPARAEWKEIMIRPSQENELADKVVQKIIKKVREKGDKAIRKYTYELDGVRLKRSNVSAKKISEAATLVPDELKMAIGIAKKNIETFHQAQRREEMEIETMPGIKCWRKSVPINTIGLYIPGGAAPLFSTVLMLAAPAQLAGCKKIVLCSPADRNGNIHPAILYTASICGIEEIHAIGGAQAIAAMAYGTVSVPKVDKIFGPGNKYVTHAKQLVQRDVAIDMPAGPSEVLVIADENAEASFVAADLLSQLEHGVDSQAILLTTSEKLAIEVQEQLNVQVKDLKEDDDTQRSFDNCRIILLDSVDDAIAFSDEYAPEHLILNCDRAGNIANKISNAGSVFIGNYSPESAGDYASGTNHTLPTNGYAKAYSGVSIDSFVKKITYQELTVEGLGNIASTVMIMAEAEGLDAHKNSIAIRLKK